MKFLILRFSSIGDIVLTTPVIRCLKKKFPESKIHFATKKVFAELVRFNPYIDKVHLLEDSETEFWKEIKAENFDYIIDLHNNQRTALIKMKLGTKSLSFNKLNWQKWLMVNFKINRLPDQHIVDRYLAACTSLGVANDYEGLDYFIPDQDKVEVSSLPQPFHAGYVCWAIGATHYTKRLPVQKISAAIIRLNIPVILLGGPGDVKAADEIMSGVSSTSAMVYNGVGKHSINQSASLIANASALISNDTGLMHIGAALKKPVVSLWGSTIPSFGMTPYYGNNLIRYAEIQVNDLSCRPCKKIGRNDCPKGHFNCMNNISEDEIVNKVKEILRPYTLNPIL